jgi:hypothetical protein
VIDTQAADFESRVRSYEVLAEAFGLAGARRMAA